MLRPLLLVFLAPVIGHAGLIVNGGFETGTFSGWSANGPIGSGVVCSDRNYPAHSGNCAAVFSSDLGNPLIVSQSVTTTPGAAYTFDFWLVRLFSGTGLTFSASWDGNVILSLTNQSSGFAYTHESFLVTATGTSTAVSFSGDGHLSQRYALDDVDVTANAPEPGTAAMLFCGLALVLWARRGTASGVR